MTLSVPADYTARLKSPVSASYQLTRADSPVHGEPEQIDKIDPSGLDDLIVFDPIVIDPPAIDDRPQITIPSIGDLFDVPAPPRGPQTWIEWYEYMLLRADNINGGTALVFLSENTAEPDFVPGWLVSFNDWKLNSKWIPGLKPWVTTLPGMQSVIVHVTASSQDRVYLHGHRTYGTSGVTLGNNYIENCFTLEWLQKNPLKAKEIVRVLKPGGKLILISCENDPDDIQAISDRLGITVIAGRGLLRSWDPLQWPGVIVARPGRQPIWWRN